MSALNSATSRMARLPTMIGFDDRYLRRAAACANGMARLLSWTDGTPTASHNGTGVGPKVNNVGSSMSFTVPASTQTRTLKVYAFGWYSNMELEVSVSDSSFATASSGPTGSGSGNVYFRTFTITYTAGSDNQKLTVTLKNVAGQQSWGQIGMQGAALSLTGGGGGGGGTPPASASNLTANAASTTQVNLAWADNASTETGFLIERATDSNFTQNLTRFAVGQDITRFADVTAVANTTYYYRILATGEGGAAAASSGVSVQTPTTTGGGTTVTQTRTHNNQNQLTAISDGSGNTPLAYDANGNMTTDQEGRTLIYDAWNRLVEVKDGSTTLQRYEYDALKRRIEADGVKFFHSAQWQVLEERDATTDAVTTQYVWSPVYVDAMVLRDRDANASAGDGLEERLYATHDANFNITALTDTAGNVVERYLYDPYGQATVLDANWTVDADGISDFGWQYLHQGGRFDAATGLYHFRNRDYSPTLGRWVQQDRHSSGPYVDGANSYGAFVSSPVVYLDPSGEAVYIVMRQFNDESAKGRQKNKRSFECCLRIGHGYLVFTDDGNQVENTFSWHPARFRKMSGQTIASSPGRVWENAKEDLNPLARGLAYREYLITEDPAVQERLMREVRDFINDAGVGYDRGDSKDDPDPRYPNNTIGSDEHRAPQKGAPTYELFGDNCVSWTVVMLDRAGINAPNGIDEYNFGVYNRPKPDKPHLRGTGPKLHLR